MKDVDKSEVYLLREKTLWRDRKGRVMLIYQRWFQGTGADYRCVTVEIFLIENQTIVSRPYGEVTDLIKKKKMVFLRDAVVPNI